MGAADAAAGAGGGGLLGAVLGYLAGRWHAARRHRRPHLTVTLDVGAPPPDVDDVSW